MKCQIRWAALTPTVSYWAAWVGCGLCPERNFFSGFASEARSYGTVDVWGLLGYSKRQGTHFQSGQLQTTGR